MITILVMTVAELSAAHQDPIRSVEQGLRNIDGINRSSTHDPEDSDVLGVVESGRLGQVCAPIGAPIAQESYDPWLKLGRLIF